MMDAREYSFEIDGPKRLRVARIEGDRYRVSLDGAGLREVARVPKVLQSVTLPDGSELIFEWRPGAFAVGEGWHIARNGAPLPGTVADPSHVVTQAAGALITAAVLAGVGAILAIAGVGAVRAIGGSAWGLIDATLLALLGWRTTRRSTVALLAGMALFVAGSIVGLRNAVLVTGQSAQVGLTLSVFLRIGLFLAMARAVPVLLKKRA